MPRQPLLLFALLLPLAAAAERFEQIHVVEASGPPGWATWLGAPSWDGSSLAWMQYFEWPGSSPGVPDRSLWLHPLGGTTEIVDLGDDAGSEAELRAAGFSLDDGVPVWRLVAGHPWAPQSDPGVGLYRRGDSGEPVLLVTHDSPFPPPDYPFLSPGPPSARAGRIAFMGQRHDGQSGRRMGAYLREAGVLHELPVPDGWTPGGFLDVPSPVALGGSSAAFPAFRLEEEPTPRFAYLLQHVALDGGPPFAGSIWARDGDVLPGGGQLAQIQNVQLDRTRGDAACFLGRAEDGAAGIFVASAAGIERIADQATPIPDGVGTFEELGGCAMDRGQVAFLGQGSAGQVGIYLGAPGGPLRKVIDRSDTLDGLAIHELDFGAEGLFAGRVAFTARLGEEYPDRDAVYCPEPSREAGLVAAGALLALAASRGISMRRSALRARSDETSPRRAPMSPEGP